MNRCCALLFAPLLLLLPLLAMAEPEQPDPYTVQHWGKGYRFAQQGWISVHIEGEPLERGLQHGHLLAPEIAAYVQAMDQTTWEQPKGAWIDAKKAFYVVGSKKRGAMGPTIPSFATREGAQKFADTEGGKVHPFPEITADMARLDGGALHDQRM